MKNYILLLALTFATGAYCGNPYQVPAGQYRPNAANGIHTGLRTQRRPEKDVRRNKPKRNPTRELSSPATGFRIHRIPHPPESAACPRNPTRKIVLSPQEKNPTACRAMSFRKPAISPSRKIGHKKRSGSAIIHWVTNSVS